MRSWILALGLLLGCNKDTRVEELEIDGDVNSLLVKSGKGEINLTPSEDGKVRVTATLVCKNTKWSYTLKDGELTLKKRCRFLHLSPCWVDFSIEAPPQVVADLRAGDGDVSVTDWEGPVAITSDEGAIDVAGLAGELDVVTDQGVVTGTELFCPDIAIDGGSGAVSLDVVDDGFAQIAVDNGAGDVEIYLPTNGTYNVETDTNKGAIYLRDVYTSSESDHLVTVETSSGDITIAGQ